MPLRIEDYALLGDLQTAALVGNDGSIDWLCLPSFDSPACFAALLGDERAGRWRIAPVATETATARRYRGDSLVLETGWLTADGEVRVIDFMPPRGEAPDVVRIVEGHSGAVPVRMSLRLRFDYGHVVPWVRQQGRDWVAVGGPDAVWLRAGIPVSGPDRPAGVGDPDAEIRAEFTVRAGDRVPFVLTYQPSHLSPPTPVDPYRARTDTERFWEAWIDQCSYTGRWAPDVRRSLVLLKALTYRPTGGIVAAATTSLPEHIGGVRNWDYRFCWLRDAMFTLQALLGTGFVAEAEAWRDWLLRAVAGDPAGLQLMYGLDGSRRLPGQTLPWLSGYEGSAPVRIGNAAVDQWQLDVWGEVLDGFSLARQAGIDVIEPGWDLQRAMLDYLEGSWRWPDNGLWEVRSERRHFTHSKVMAWAAFDRAVTAVKHHGLDGPVDRWQAIRDEIHADVCANAYDAGRNTFTQSYSSPHLDAALLLIPRVGFLAPDDPRVAGTVEAVQRDLQRDGLVYRYAQPGDARADGLPGSEGAFLACSFWLVDALAMLGRRQEAERLFERLLELRNDVGLLSEEYDPHARRHLGNTPQAFSLVGLVNSARLLTGSTTRTTEDQG